MYRAVSDAELLKAFRALLRTVRDQTDLTAEYGVSEAQYLVLQYVADAGRELSVSEIAERTGTDVSAATRKCADLDRLGLLGRAHIECDRRKTMQQLTDKGQRVLEQIRRDADARLLEVLQRVPCAQRGTLIGLLEQLATVSVTCVSPS